MQPGGIKKVGKCQITKRQTVAIGGADAHNDDDGHQWYLCDTPDKNPLLSVQAHFSKCKTNVLKCRFLQSHTFMY